MFIMMMIMLMITTISMMMMMLNYLLSMKIINNHEKMTPLECGFMTMNKNQLPFSIQFYYMAILFLIFDIEIAMIMPMIQNINQIMINQWMMFSFIILILLIGLYIEWWKNLIKWNK